MHRITLDGTELQVSKVGFGTALLHHSFSSSGRKSILRAALDGGITHFDTARLYGSGIAEKELGRFCGKYIRKEITLSTKVGFHINKVQKKIPMINAAYKKIIRSISDKGGEQLADFSPKGCEKSLSDSLRCLNTEWVDILFVHEPALANLSQLEKLIPWMQLQKSLGKARYIGLAGERLDNLDILTLFPNVFDVLQTSKESMKYNHLLPIKPQIQYGYFANLPELQRTKAIKDIKYQNESGIVLYSSRKKSRVEEFCAQFSSC